MRHLIFLLLISTTSLAGTITVSNTNDSGAGSLRQSVTDAAPYDTVLFDAALNGDTIRLTSGQITLDKTMMILGNNPVNTIIKSESNARIFEVPAQDTVILNGLNLVNGDAGANNGGGILNAGMLEIILCFVQNCSAANGGAIYNSDGLLDISTSLMIGCDASANGGGIYNTVNGRLIMNNVSVSSAQAGSDGGGIYNAGLLEMTGGTITQNSAMAGGGFYSTDSLVLTNITVSYNAATNNGGGIFSSASSLLSLTSASIDTNTATNGAAVYDLGQSDLYGSSFAGNEAGSNGGAWWLSGDAVVRNSTFSSNTALSGGGAWYNNGGSLTSLNNTLTLNEANNGGAIFMDGDCGFKNTLIAQNTANQQGNDLFYNSGTLNSVGYNLLGTEEGVNWTANTGDIVGTIASPADPELYPLADNGGPTLTHGFPCSSIVHNAGTNNGAPSTDQRGFSRVGTTDIGAFEAQFIIPSPDLGTDFEVCEGETAELELGSASDSIIWYDGSGNILHLDTHQYSWTVNQTDTIIIEQFTPQSGDCSTFDTLIVDTITPVVPTITQVDNELTSSSAQEYQWLLDGDTLVGAVNQTLLATESGNYSVATIDDNGCFAVSDEVFVSITSVENTFLEAVEIYPNPTAGDLHIRLNQDIELLQLYDVFGRQLMQRNNMKGNATITINMREYPAGSYFLKLRYWKGETASVLVFRK